ncbi:MAG TPA: hypothetical protein DEP67_09200, partial [Lachnospiraceae bacterium]|nr:hypothetical protein [Lachnospiraceae bacterium]
MQHLTVSCGQQCIESEAGSGRQGAGCADRADSEAGFIELYKPPEGSCKLRFTADGDAGICALQT